MKRKTLSRITTRILKSHNPKILGLSSTNHPEISHICRLSKISYSKRDPNLIFIQVSTQIISNQSLILTFHPSNKKA